MASAKPVIHGGDHNEGGSDPTRDIALSIRFDRLNGNTADHWLNVLTTEPTPPGGVEGIALTDSGGAGIKFYAEGGGNNLEARADGDLILSGADGASLTSSGNGITISANSALGITAGAGTTLATIGNTLVTSVGGITLTAGLSGASSPNGDLNVGGYDSVFMDCVIGDIEISISNAGSPGDRCLRVTSQAASPNEIFRVDSDGTIHGQASVGTILWDIV